MNKNNLLPLWLRRLAPHQLLLATVAIVLLTLSVRAVIAIATDYVYEDALITYRYAENIAAGNGFVYNQGETVLGTSTPLYALVLAAFKVVGISVFFMGRILNIIAAGVTAFLIIQLLRKAESFWLAILAGLLFALSPASVAWAISGMETAVFTCLTLLTLYFYANNRLKISAFVAVLMVATRIDGFILVSVLGIHYLVSHRRIPWYPIVLFATLSGLWFLWISLTFGSPIPNSLVAKAAVYSGWVDSPWPNFRIVFEKFFSRGGPAGAGMFLLAILGIYYIARTKREFLPIAIWFVAYWALYIGSKTLLFGWYFVPTLPAWILFVVAGLALVVRTVTRRSQTLFSFVSPRFLQWGLVAMVGLAAMLPLQARYEQISRQQHIEDNLRKPIGIWLKENTPAESTILLEPIGYIGYYSERFIYDTPGLVTPDMIPLNRKDPLDLCAQIRAFSPDYLVLRDSSVVGSCANRTEGSSDKYILIKEFSYRSAYFGYEDYYAIFKNRAVD